MFRKHNRKSPNIKPLPFQPSSLKQVPSYTKYYFRYIGAAYNIFLRIQTLTHKITIEFVERTCNALQNYNKLGTNKRAPKARAEKCKKVPKIFYCQAKSQSRSARLTLKSQSHGPKVSRICDRATANVKRWIKFESSTTKTVGEDRFLRKKFTE